MARKNPLIRSYPKSVNKPSPHKSKGILDDFAVRKNVATKEGTVEKIPVNDSDIANKKYVDDSFPVTHASTTGQTTDDHHAQSHNIASHSDTTATGTELNTLTDDSMADALHRHSELSASDGTPNPAVSVDASGNVGIAGATAPTYEFELGSYTKAGDNVISLQHAAGSHFNVIRFEEFSSKYGFSIYTEGAGNTFNIGSRDNSDTTTPAITIERDTRNVGIGTAGPNSKFQIDSPQNASAFSIYNSTVSKLMQQTFLGANDHPIFVLYEDDGSTVGVDFRTDGSDNFIRSGNVGIGTTTPATSAKLDINSTTGALLLPRMTTTQRNALTAVNGMLIYNTTTTVLEAYENGAWVNL